MALEKVNMASSTDNEMRAQAEGMVSYLIHNEGVPRDEAERKAAAMIGLLEVEKPVLIMRLWNAEWQIERAARGGEIAKMMWQVTGIMVGAFIITAIIFDQTGIWGGELALLELFLFFAVWIAVTAGLIFALVPSRTPR